jgi:hypothetical protein
MRHHRNGTCRKLSKSYCARFCYKRWWSRGPVELRTILPASCENWIRRHLSSKLQLPHLSGVQSRRSRCRTSRHKRERSTSSGRAAPSSFPLTSKLFNQKAVPKALTYSNGTVTLYGVLTDEFKVYKAGERQGQLESILLLGFGSRGKEIASKWEVSFLRQETLFGVKCDILQLIPKDLEVTKQLRRVKTWFDSSRAVPLKQIFDEGDGLRCVCVCTNLTVNAKLPDDAFNPKANPQAR